MTVQVL